MELNNFLEKNKISQEDWRKANVSLDLLCKIKDDYENQIPHLNESAEFLAKVLQKSNHVHSVRWRVKDSEHVLEKIVRKKASGSTKYKDITLDNYAILITDLIGVRVLHLFKHEWIDIHKYIKNYWLPIENVVAYIREGDEGIVIDSYKENDCKVEIHPAGYRSIHYIVSTQPTLKKVLAEIQVRTIFEEGWSEIDHKVRYPSFLDNKLVSYFLTIFNRMAGSADEMGTFVNNLISEIKWNELQSDLKQKEEEDHLIKIEDLAKELSKERSANKNHEKSLKTLQEEIENLRKNSIKKSDYLLSTIRLSEMEKMNSLSREALKNSNLTKLNKEQLNAIKLSDINEFSKAYENTLKEIKHPAINVILKKKSPKNDDEEKN